MRAPRGTSASNAGSSCTIVPTPGVSSGAEAVLSDREHAIVEIAITITARVLLMENPLELRRMQDHKCGANSDARPFALKQAQRESPSCARERLQPASGRPASRQSVFRGCGQIAVHRRLEPRRATARFSRK